MCVAPSAGDEQLAVQAGEGLGRTIVGAQPEEQAPPVLDEAACAVDELLHHRLEPPALALSIAKVSMSSGSQPHGKTP